MIVGVDAPRHDCHLPGVEDLRAPASQRLDLLGLADGHEPPALDGEGLSARLQWIDRVDLAVDQDEIGLWCGADLRQRLVAGHEARDAGAREAHEMSAAVSRHRYLASRASAFARGKSCAPERARQACLGATDLCAYGEGDGQCDLMKPMMAETAGLSFPKKP